MVLRTNRTVSDIPITWNQARFHTIRSKYRQARKLIEISINVQLEKQLKNLGLQNIYIEKEINEINENITKHQRKLQTVDSFLNIGSESVSNHFDKRMKKIRNVIKKQCNIIQNVLHEENEYWKEIYSVITSNNCPKFYQDENHSELSNDDLLPTIKQEWPQIVVSPEKSDHRMPYIDTYDVKMEESIDLSSSQFSISQRAVSPMFTQPKFPEQLYFSPTILQVEQSEPIESIHSPFDEKEELFDSIEPILELERLSHSFLLQYLNKDDIEYSDIQSNDCSQNHRPRTRSTVTKESQPIDRTKSRKRNRSLSTNNHTRITLRKRKSVVIIDTESKIRKTKKIKKDQKLSPISVIDKSKHYTTRFPRRFRPLENISSSVIEIDNKNDDNNSWNVRTRLRKRS